MDFTNNNTGIPGFSRLDRPKKSSAHTTHSRHESRSSMKHTLDITKHPNGPKKFKSSHHSKSQHLRHRSSSSKSYDDSKTHKSKHHQEASNDRVVSLCNGDLVAVQNVGDTMTWTKMNSARLAVHPLVQQIVKSAIEDNEKEMRNQFEERFKLFMDVNADRRFRTTRSLTNENQLLKSGSQLAIENDASKGKRRKQSSHNNVTSTVTTAKHSCDVSSPSSTSAQSFHGFNFDSSFDEVPGMRLTEVPRARLVVPKNTNRNHYIKHPSSNSCIVCHKSFKRMVSHLKYVHPNQEVFVSRFAPQMADDARNNRNVVELFTKNTIRYIKAMCYFCEKIQSFMPQYWIMHIRSHTGEYAHYCNNCKKNVCFHQHCGIATECRDIIDLKTTDLMAYICRDCNFIQIRKKNMHNHLANEHKFSDYEQRYEKILLLQAWDRQPVQNEAVPGTSSMDCRANHQPNIENNFPDNVQSGEKSPEDRTGYGHVPLNDDPFKLDANEENILKNVSDFYRQTNKHTITVRPWIIDDYTKKPSMCLITQFALFKCMHSNCIFSTDVEDKWTEHMVDHIKLMDVFQQKGWLTTTVRQNQIKFRECPYCPVEFGSNCEVTSHIEEEHRRSIFQCAHCFYRTIEMDNIVLHYQQFHENGNAEILLTGDWRAFEERDNEILIEGGQYFRQIECSDCDKRFSYFDSFYQHLSVVHSSKYTCKYCERVIKCSDMEVQSHLQSHGFDEYQCLHCKASSSDIAQMRIHMTNDHSSHFLFIASRRSTAPIIYIGGAYECSHFKLLLCQFVDALSSMNPKLSMINQHKTVYDFWMAKQITRVFPTEIPPISFTNNDFSTFVMFDDYEKHRAHASEPMSTNGDNHTNNDAAVIYKCLTTLAINEIRRVESSDYTRLKCDCSKSVNITDLNSLKPYIDHLDMHSTCFSSENEKTMIAHRVTKHAKSQLAFLQIDLDNHVQKLIRCTFQCDEEHCNVECETKAEMNEHYNRYHQDCLFNSRIKSYTLVIDSNDPEQMFASRAVVADRFQFGQIFQCRIDDEMVASKAEVLLHNQNEHSSNDVEFRMKTLILDTNQYRDALKCIALENASPYRMYLLECINCGSFFDSPDSMHQHFVEAEHPGDVQFMARKLIACSFCQVIGTFQQLEHHHAAKHANQVFNPVSALHKMVCGLCNKGLSRNEDLSLHYRSHHSNGENHSNAFLKRLQLNENDCEFEPACCLATKYNQLLGLAQHLATCNRTFSCTKFSCTETFENLQQMVDHHIIVHKTSTEDIINDIQHIDELLTSFSTSRIHFPSGLVIIMHSIEASKLETKLKAAFIQHINNDIWPTEIRHIQSFASRIEKRTGFQKIFSKYIGKK